MTIRVGIENMDTREDALIVVKIQNMDNTPMSGHDDTPLPGGAKTEKYVHDSQRLVIEEVSPLHMRSE